MIYLQLSGQGACDGADKDVLERGILWGFDWE